MEEDSDAHKRLTDGLEMFSGEWKDKWWWTLESRLNEALHLSRQASNASLLRQISVYKDVAVRCIQYIECVRNPEEEVCKWKLVLYSRIEEDTKDLLSGFKRTRSRKDFHFAWFSLLPLWSQASMSLRAARKVEQNKLQSMHAVSNLNH